MPFMYASSATRREIEPDLLQRGRAGRLGFEILPEKPVPTGKVRWTQKDNWFGLQQMRGLDGAPLHVYRVGHKTWEYEPGYFGEFTEVTETELTNRASSVDVTTVSINVNDLVAEAREILVGREWERKETSIWTLLTTGILQIVQDGEDGVQVTYRDQYSFQQYTPTYPWSNLALSTPIKNFQSVQQMGEALGHSVDFGAAATAYGNQVTINNLINNQNPDDFGGRRAQFGATLNAMPAFNSYFAAQNLPQLKVYDASYQLRKNSPRIKYIPDGVLVVVGRRFSGEPLGFYNITRNASAGYRSVSYEYVIDRANALIAGAAPSEKRTPANIEVHRGHNGGPSIDFPSSVVVMHV